MSPAQTPQNTAQERPSVAVYYFPNYHLDARNEKFKGKGWSEWELVKAACPRFEGHRQPIVPLWGYTDEADPLTMAQKIDAAAAHGIDAFIFDWYYYNDGPYLERALDEGFLHAPNNSALKFALMWANHDWKDIHPASPDVKGATLYPGLVTPETWEKITDLVIEKYFKHPSYWKISGKPYFSFYEVQTFARGFDDARGAREALDRFRRKAKNAGFPDLHLNVVMWGRPILPGEMPVDNPQEIVKTLGFDSVTSYVWVHHAGTGNPTRPFDEMKQEYFEYARQAFDTFGVPYYPNASMGWDSSPRTDQSKPWKVEGYPYTGVITGNAPAAFKQSLQELKTMLMARPANERILTINSWNEWTEGSYLEPDTENKYGYLQAIREVFGPQKS